MKQKRLKKLAVLAVDLVLVAALVWLVAGLASKEQNKHTVSGGTEFKYEDDDLEIPEENDPQINGEKDPEPSGEVETNPDGDKDVDTGGSNDTGNTGNTGGTTGGDTTTGGSTSTETTEPETTKPAVPDEDDADVIINFEDFFN